MPRVEAEARGRSRGFGQKIPVQEQLGPRLAHLHDQLMTMRLDAAPRRGAVDVAELAVDELESADGVGMRADECCELIAADATDDADISATLVERRKIHANVVFLGGH